MSDSDNTDSELTLDILKDQLPDSFEKQVQRQLEVYDRMGAEVLGLGQLHVDDPNKFDSSNISQDEVKSLEVFIGLGNERFLYTIFPNEEFNVLEGTYDLFQQILFFADVDRIREMDEDKRAKLVNGASEVLSEGDVNAVLSQNRTARKTQFSVWLNMLKSQNPEFVHVLNKTESGEVVSVNVQRRVYPTSNDAAELEEHMYTRFQTLANVIDSYRELLNLAYLDSIPTIPDSMAEKLQNTNSSENTEWASSKQQEEGAAIGFQ